MSSGNQSQEIRKRKSCLTSFDNLDQTVPEALLWVISITSSIIFSFVSMPIWAVSVSYQMDTIYFNWIIQWRYFFISKWRLGSIKCMGFLRDNQSPTQESLTQALLHLDKNSDFGFFAWDLLKHSCFSQSLHSLLGYYGVTFQPNQALPPGPYTNISPLGDAGGGSGAIRDPVGRLERTLPSPCTSSNFTVYWVDLWEKVIKACKSSCWRENYLYKQSVITGIGEATCGKGH